jgi:hypothetical protein
LAARISALSGCSACSSRVSSDRRAGALGDGVDLRDVALGDLLLHVAVHALQRPQQHHVHAVVAPGALQVLAAVAHQLLELAGDGLDVVEDDAEVDDVVADHGGEQQLHLLVGQLQAHLPQLAGELAADVVELGAIAADVAHALLDQPVVVGDGALDDGLARGGDALLAVVVDLARGRRRWPGQLADALAVALHAGGGQDGDGLVEQGVDVVVGIALVAAEPGAVRQLLLAVLQRSVSSSVGTTSVHMARNGSTSSGVSARPASCQAFRVASRERCHQSPAVSRDCSQRSAAPSRDCRHRSPVAGRAGLIEQGRLAPIVDVNSSV